MWGGYQGAGNKTIIPAEAGIKITMRLAPDQDPRVVSQLLKRHIESFASETVAVSCEIGEEAWYFQLVTDGPWLEAVQSAIEATVGSRAQLVRTGGSIPILGVFNRLIGLPITGFGYGDGEGIHSPNEYLKIEDRSGGAPVPSSNRRWKRLCACITIWGKSRFRDDRWTRWSCRGDLSGRPSASDNR